MRTLSQNFDYTQRLVPKNSEGGSKSTKHTNIQYKYVWNLAKVKFSEDCIITYNTRGPFPIPTLVDDYFGAVADRWGNRAATGYNFCPTGRGFLSV